MTVPACKCKVPPCGPMLHLADCPKVQPYSISAPIPQVPTDWIARRAEEARAYLESLPPELLGPAARTLLGYDHQIDGQWLKSVRLSLRDLVVGPIPKVQPGRYVVDVSNDEPQMVTFVPIEMTKYAEGDRQ